MALRVSYSDPRLIGTSIIGLAIYCNQMLPVLIVSNNIQNHWLMLSICCRYI